MTPAITDVPGVLVGHAHDPAALTGCTVVLTTAGAVGGVDVRGGGPGTRETDLLNPSASIAIIHAIALCGGSAFGLAAATGVMDWLQERDIGFTTQIRKIPIVPAAVIFDLGLGRADRWADAAMGYAACAAAGPAVAEGCVGVGSGATVGKLLGMQGAVKSGVGTWSETLADGTVIGALAVCNAVGDVYREASEQIIAGARDPQSGRFANTMALLRVPAFQSAMSAVMSGENTTLAVVATDALLTKAEATKLAQMAQDALPRMIRPVHTPFDGDTVFALSTGQRTGQHLAILGAIAADVLARAIARCVLTATRVGDLPAARDLGSGDRET
jgi:L-aminopeptidase/D-esterase-like protein